MAKITIEYCSKYDSYNGEEVTEGKVLAPVLIPDAEYKHNNTIIKENLRTWTHHGVNFRVGFMVVDEEDFDKMLSLYYSGINDYMEDHPELRPGRCLLGVDTDGMPILCSKDNRCKGCPHRSEHLPRYKNLEDYIQFVSLQDTHEDEDGIEIADPSANVEDAVLYAALFKDLITYLEKKNPRYAAMVRLGYEGHKPEEIFEAVGLKSSFGYKEWNRAKKLVKEFLAD